MLQIFVHKSVVDEVAYGCVPFGAVAPGGRPISRQAAPRAGQAWLLAAPALFLKQEVVRTFAHCDAWAYGPLQSRLLIDALRKAVGPYFSDPRNCEIARLGLTTRG